MSSPPVADLARVHRGYLSLAKRTVSILLSARRHPRVDWRRPLAALRHRRRCYLLVHVSWIDPDASLHDGVCHRLPAHRAAPAHADAASRPTRYDRAGDCAGGLRRRRACRTLGHSRSRVRLRYLPCSSSFATAPFPDARDGPPGRRRPPLCLLPDRCAHRNRGAGHEIAAAEMNTLAPWHRPTRGLLTGQEQGPFLCPCSWRRQSWSCRSCSGMPPLADLGSSPRQTWSSAVAYVSRRRRDLRKPVLEANLGLRIPAGPSPDVSAA